MDLGTYKGLLSKMLILQCRLLSVPRSPWEPNPVSLVACLSAYIYIYIYGSRSITEVISW